MTTHKLIGISEEGEGRLHVDDLMLLEDYMLQEISLSDEEAPDGGRVFIMPEGEEFHEDFIIVEQLKSDSEKLKIITDLMIDHCNNKYFDLVWYARVNPKNYSEEQYLKIIRNMQEKYPEETKKLSGKDSDWTHGFNSGMLAAARFYLSVMEDGIEQANEDFPELDS